MELTLLVASLPQPTTAPKISLSMIGACPRKSTIFGSSTRDIANDWPLGSRRVNHGDIRWLDKPEPRHCCPNNLRDVRGYEMGIVPLGHAGVCVTEVRRDHRQRHPSLQQVGGVGVAQDVK